MTRCNWLEDASASARILPPLNLCFDLDDTLIFNAPVRGAKETPTFVVREPPHLLVEDVDPSRAVGCHCALLVIPPRGNVRLLRPRKVVGFLMECQTPKSSGSQLGPTQISFRGGFLQKKNVAPNLFLF